MAVPYLAEQVGRVLAGRYRLVSLIGTGVSAAVYLAIDTKMRRRVAIKILHAALSQDKSFTKRFTAEAHTAANLSHPHIMRVWDWGEDQREPFLVLEYFGGGSLRQVLDMQGKLSLVQATKIGLHTARALDYAHRHRLVHRDIKPANLLFDDEGRVAIADFGLARALASAAQTEPGTMLGTARYAAPEQVRGKQLRGSADVYALALVLIEAISGEVPFVTDTTIATLMARLEQPVDIPDSCGPLIDCLTSATHINPEARISARDFAYLLEVALRDMPTPEAIALPGAFVVDATRLDSGADATLIPGAYEKVNEEMPPEVISENNSDVIPNTSMQNLDIHKSHIATPAVQASGAQEGSEKHEKRDSSAAISPVENHQPKRKMRRLKQAVIILMLALLIAAMSIGCVYAYYNTGRELVVPQMIGMTLDGAKLRANESDIKVRIREVFSEDVPTGTVVNQIPQTADKVHAREFVTLEVSKGPAPRNMPNVIGQQRNEAVEALRNAGFAVDDENVKKVASETEPTNKVLEQNPSTGMYDKGHRVELTVSSGPRPRIIPSVQGMSQEEAVRLLEGQQLRVKITQGYSDTVPAGKAANTAPAVGQSVPRDSTVTLVISRGPEMISVPDVSGTDATAAAEKLGQAGLKVTAVYGPPEAKTVFSTSPTAGTKVKKGSDIAIYKR